MFLQLSDLDFLQIQYSTMIPVNLGHRLLAEDAKIPLNMTE